MKPLDADTLDLLWFDQAARETRLRQLIMERMAEAAAAGGRSRGGQLLSGPRNTAISAAVKEIAYHATSGVKNPPPGSLLAQCTAQAAGIDPWDASGRMGLLHVAFPLKMMLQPDGHLTSSDLLHTVAGAIIFDVYDSQDARLVSLQIPEHVLRTFPGPAYGPLGLRQATHFAPAEPAFGTILKPTAGITPDEVGELVTEVARCPLFLFVKEDEDLYPNLDYSPVRQRVQKAVEAIERSKDKRGGRGLIFAPHIPVPRTRCWKPCTR